MHETMIKDGKCYASESLQQLQCPLVNSLQIPHPDTTTMLGTNCVLL